MLGLLLLLQFPSDIVVTGHRLVEAQAECASGACTPLRDAQATIALAEVQFRDGNYRDAKALLAAAVSRNRDKAAEAPRPVAAIYEAYATVALHEGDKRAYRRAVANQVNVLQDHLPADDPSVESASTALGDMWIELRDYRQAAAVYRAVEADALAAGRDRSAMIAGMKRAWLTAALRRPREAADMVADLEKRPLAQTPGYRSALRVLRLRLAMRDADETAISRLVSELGQEQTAQPVLIWSPPYERNAAAAANDLKRQYDLVDAIDTRSSELSGILWADVGFWIRPDGRTGEIEILRGSHSTSWAAPALRQIAGRRYSAVADKGEATDGEPGRYRVERFTRASEYITPKGSHIRRRVATGGFEVLDLTEAPAAPPG